jgi:hypothetical protein
MNWSFAGAAGLKFHISVSGVICIMVYLIYLVYKKVLPNSYTLAPPIPLNGIHTLFSMLCAKWGNNSF